MTRKAIIIYMSLVLILGVTLMTSAMAESRRPDVLEAKLETIAATLSGWAISREDRLAPRQLAILRPTSYLARTYTKNGHDLGVLMAYYSMQKPGEAMHSPRNCLPGAGWELGEGGYTSVLAGSRSIRINRYTIQNGSKRMLALYWYQSRNRVIANEYEGKLLLLRDALVDGRTGGALVRIVARLEPAAEQEVLNFAGAIIVEAQRCLGG